MLGRLYESIKEFENTYCGGYNECISVEGEDSERHIEDTIEEFLLKEEIEHFKQASTHAFSSPGFDISILSIAYVRHDGLIDVITIELTTC